MGLPAWSRGAVRVARSRAARYGPKMTEDSAPAHIDALSSPEIASTPRYPRGSTILIGVILFVVVGGAALIFVPAALLNNWVPGLTAAEQGRLLGNAAQIVLFALGGIIAVAGVGLSLARHGEQLKAAARDTAREEFERTKESVRQAEYAAAATADAERTLRERFVVVVEMLRVGDSATTRIAGLYALAHLADDWIARGNSREAQVCIDVICSYLRAPRSEGVEVTSPAECEVKRTGFDILRAHLRSSPASWEGYAVDLHGSFIDFDVDLSDIRLDSTAFFSLRAATITGSAVVNMQRFSADGKAEVDLREVSLTGNATLDLSKVHLSGQSTVWVSGITLSGAARLLAVEAVLDGNTLVDGATFRATEDSFVSMTFSKVGERARAHFNTVELTDRARMYCGSIILSGHANVSVYGITTGPDAALHLGGIEQTESSSFLFNGGDV